MPTHITVTAPAGRVTPVHHSDGAEPGGAQLRVTAGRVARVRFSQNIRRSIARGDLMPCDMSGSAVPSVDLAAAPDDLIAPAVGSESAASAAVTSGGGATRSGEVKP